jgi:peptide/nickel transport system substrate-binding protein
MKFSQRLILVFIIILLASLLVVACGKTTTTSTSTSSTTSTTATSTTKTSTSSTTSVTTSKTTTSTSTQTTLTPQRGGTLEFVYVFSPMQGIGWPQDLGTGNAPDYVDSFVWVEPLIFYKPDGSVEPYLAKTWEIASDYSSITFHLRDDVKFHDGTAFNADAVKFNFDAAIKAGLSTASTWKSVDVVDTYTVRLNLKKFENSIWATLTDKYSMIVAPTPVREKGLDYARENPCGTGPFKFVSYERDKNVVFERNPNYWQPGKPYLDKIEFLTVVDEMTQESVLKAGQGDILGLVGGKTMSDLKASGFNTNPDPGGTFFMAFDSATAGSIFSNIKIREAVEYAINKQAIADALGHGFMYPNNQLPSPFLPFHDPNLVDRSYNLDKAKQLLAEAKLPDGFKTTWTIPPWNGDAPLMAQESLKKVGIDVTINKISDAEFWKTAMTGWKGIITGALSWDANFANIWRKWFPPDGNFYVSTKYPSEFHDMANAALAATDPATQKELNYKLIEAIHADATIVFLYSDCRGYAVAPYVHDAHFFQETQYMYWDPVNIWKSK